MKNVFLVAATLSVVGLLGGGVADAGRLSERSASAQYAAGGLADGPDGDVGIMIQGAVGGVVLPGGPERFVSITILDRTGQPVLAQLAQGKNSLRFCGETPSHVRVTPYEDLKVFLFNGTCGSGNSVVTTGTVSATFGART